MTVSITNRFWWITLVVLLIGPGVIQGQSTPAAEAPVLRHFSGRIFQGTAGAQLPPDLVVTLHKFDAIFTEQTFQTGIDPAGYFVFGDVPTDEANTYFVSTQYLNQSYAGPPFQGDPDNPTENLVIVIYEVIDDPSQIKIIGISTQIDLAPNQEGVLRVAQLLRFANDSDRLYVGNRQFGDGQSAVLDISLPIGAIVVELGSDGRFALDEERFTLIDTRPLPPGNEHVVYVVYLMPYRDAAIIEYPIGYALDGPVRVLLGTDLLSLSSDQLAAFGTEMIDGRQFLAYGRTLSLNPGDLIKYELTGSIAVGTEAEKTPGSSSNRLATFVAGAITLLIGAAVGIAVLGRGAGSSDGQGNNSQDLWQEIIDLDRQHEAGQINHDLYQRRRKELQAHIGKLTEQEPTENHS